ncbi:hypothetical protein H1Q58_10550 [Planococcus maritimus]|uniref:Uncharacterized protein n=1 Tax=Planococcus maritimus TaxID=192421 RepID=A0A7D7QUA3_PLAMR|nr:hypothetical protein [Planococcus maritimus]KYG59087.1 hypothetical protein AY633_02265 [Planococcus maritimus]OED32792.1 hypothetical protein BHE17_10185 [Planococcus maritimus]QMT16414.1 hypothetical protein H1Q58_10550 [Planococcus maritimus]
MKILKGLWIGFWSGLILGLLMKWMQAVTGIQNYELLLNIDFIPLLNQVNWSELMEFVFHLIISLVIGIVYVYIAKRRSYTFGQLTIISLVLTLPTYFLFFPLSMLAVEADVPEPTDVGAFLYWILAQLTYALLLPILYKTFERKNAASQ